MITTLIARRATEGHRRTPQVPMVRMRGPARGRRPPALPVFSARERRHLAVGHFLANTSCIFARIVGGRDLPEPEPARMRG